MDGNLLEQECSALGGLFVQIVNEMKGSTAAWEDFNSKATKLHTALRATILATSAFLDAFQKIADVATNTRGATRDMGSSLTRLCMRHRNIENKLKRFTRSIMDSLVNPLQEKIEEWKRNVTQLDKDHLKEYKKARQEIKRSSSDTIKLQKKAKKGRGDIQTRLENALQDVNDKYILLEDTEKNAVRNALIEQRSHFCIYVSYLKPVLDEEMAIITEMSLIQEIIQNLCMQADDPFNLPPASEEVISDVKRRKDVPGFTFQTPPSSPSSLGSRKSSMCSISSLASSSSGSAQAAMSPCHQLRPRPVSQPPSAIRLSSISSQDSGFTSQDTLFQAMMSSSMEYTTTDSDISETLGADVAGVLRWPNLSNRHSTPSLGGGDKRPHTISAAYEKGHPTRPTITPETFEGPERPASQTAPPTPNPYAVPCLVPPVREGEEPRFHTLKEEVIYESLKPPPGPKPRAAKQQVHQTPAKQTIPPYVNMNELAQLAAKKQQEQNMHSQNPPEYEDTYANPKQSKQNMGQVQAPNSLELAQAIRELEASTAALQMTYSGDTDESSTDPKDTTDCVTPTQENIYETVSQGYKSGIATIRRSSFSAGHRPSPPVRRSSSILGMPVKPPSVPRHTICGSEIIYATPGEPIYCTPYQTSQPPPPNPDPGPPQGHYRASRQQNTHAGGPGAHRRSSSEVRPPSSFHSSSAPRNNSGSVERKANNVGARNSTGSNDQLLAMAQQQLLRQVKTRLVERGSSAENSADTSFEELPLPPPPEEFYQTPPQVAPPHVTQEYQIPHVVSQEYHASTAHVPAGPQHAAPSQQDCSSSSSIAVDTSVPEDNDKTPTGDNPPEDHMLMQIRRGVRLRRTISNDRSAPSISKIPK